MSEKITLARPYAEAAFGRAQETKTLEEWSRALALAATVVSDPRVVALIEDPRVARERLTGLLIDLPPPPPRIHDEFRNFIKLLAENRRLALLPEISRLFEDSKAEAERVVEAEVISAFPLDEAHLKVIGDALKSRLGREVHAVPKVDPGLIGGAVIRAGDLVIDGSVQGRLRALAAYLSH